MWFYLFQGLQSGMRRCLGTRPLVSRPVTRADEAGAQCEPTG